MSNRTLTITWIAVFALGCSSTAVDSPPEPVAAEPVAAQQAPPAEDEVYENTLKWTTASELENFGYDIYRGLSEEGPFERLTEEPLPGAGTTDEPTDYQFVDDTIDPYETYWYYVESISMGGVRERFTPIFPSKPKLEREQAEAPPVEPDPDGR